MMTDCMSCGEADATQPVAGPMWCEECWESMTGEEREPIIRVCPRCRRFTALETCARCGGATKVYGEEE